MAHSDFVISSVMLFIPFVHVAVCLNTKTACALYAVVIFLLREKW
jgi:hypothetical protein